MREPSAWWRKPGDAASLLLPLSAVYDMIAVRRMRRRGERATVPVICVGNPTVGGAGKTPAAIAIARLLQAAGRKPAFLSRGYGGRHRGPISVDPGWDAQTVGDEPLLLSRVAPTVVARDRKAGADAAIAAGADVIVMDDGFQNPSLVKNFSILVVDGRRGTGNARVIPAGPLRANLPAQLDRAHALLVVGEGSEFAAPAVDGAARRQLPVWRARLVPDPKSIAALAEQPLIAFAGIGDPDKFFATLDRAGLDVRGRVGFADHHRFTEQDAAELLGRADRDGLVPVTTEKDHVRLRGTASLGELARRARTVPVDLVFDQEDAVRECLLAVAPAA
jgi:tetraacyldisaccharide 4'-kinase